jgi:archaellum biogenesis ATPase FlaH
MAMCCSIIKPSYFDPSLKKTAKFIQEYFQKYNDVPKIITVRAETGALLEDPGRIDSAETKFIADEVETFCRNRAVTEAILAGPELLHKGDFGKIIDELKQAISVGLQKDLGLDYFTNPTERLYQTLQVQAKISTGIKELDDAIGGGISRQELLMFAANSGGGKSMTMLNVAKNLLKQGLNGVYISLEMAEGVVSKRLDSMVTKIAQDSLAADIEKTARIIQRESEKMGKFLIKRMPENRTNVNTIRSYLQQVEQATGFRPDFIVIDYIDIMGTTMSISHDNLFVKDKYVTEEVRSLGFDFNCIMISASQLGRCLSENSLITLASGEKVQLKDIKVGDILAGSELPVEVVAKTEREKKKLYKITLQNGKHILVTAEHRFPVSGGGTKSIASGLAVGDSLFTD